MKKKELTKAMEMALSILAVNGAVFAGYNTSKLGAATRVSAKTLTALEHRGYVVIDIGPDGGMMARRVSGE